MHFTKLIVSIVTLICLTACNTQIEFNIKAPSKIQIHQKLEASLIDANFNESEVEYFIDNNSVSTQKELSLDINNYTLGSHILKVVVGEKENKVTKTKKITFLASKKPKIYTYKVINSYPHNRTAFTQGLEFYKNDLYEGTGKRGQSFLRKINLETGETIQEKGLANKYFGEGITIFNDKIYQLTWQNKIGFVYDVNTFEPLQTFKYQNSSEGWGLTHNNTSLIKSDGTEKIWFLDPENGKEKNYIQAYTNKKPIKNINELEYFNGKIYANIWTINAIAIINPKNGAVEALVNMKGLAKQLDNKTIENSSDSVLNGIAYNPINQKLYVTGKNWDKIFEIEILE